MNVQDTTELIWHFAGYLKLDEDFLKARIIYEDAEATPLGDIDPAALDDALLVPAALEIDSVFGGLPLLAGPAPLRVPHWDSAGTPKMAAVSMPRFEEDDLAVRLAKGSWSTGATGAVGSSLRIQTMQSRDPEPSETLLDARQLNRLEDRDRFQTDQDWSGELPTPSDSNPLDALAEAAEAAIPADLAALSGGAEDLVAFARNLGSSDDGGAGLAPTVEAGRYHNETQLDSDEELPEDLGPDLPALPEPTNGPTGDLGITTQAAETGANQAYNGALIVDMNGACGTLVVLGDRYELNIVVQINAYSDDDRLTLDGSGAGSIVGGGNDADNLSTLTEEDGLATLTLAKAGATFRVDLVEGDFFDVRALVQRNIADDDDVVVQTGTGYYSLARTGDNELINIASIKDFNLGSNYDVIVVGGRCYDINAIIQLNLLRDNDAVSVSGDGDDTGSVAGGGNSLVNSAMIANYDVSGSLDLPDGMLDWVRSLDAIPSGEWASFGFTDGGDGFIDVLYVTGDYFDLNLIYQVNVVTDIDVVVQDASTAEDDTTQLASTGGNSLQNEAIIIDVDALAGIYVGGDTYEGSILIQANLVESDDDLVIGDTNTLVPELIAFTEGPEATPPDPAVAEPLTTADHGIGSIMT